MADYPPLATEVDLSYLPGAPFSDDEIATGVAAVRRAARWHIAPEVTETVTLDVARFERWLRLPTRKLVSVTEVRNADTGDVIDPATYRVSRTLGQIKRNTWWPAGYEAVEVDITHGFATCPPDLFPVIVQAISMGRRDRSVQSVQIDDFSTRYDTAAITGSLRAALGDYAVTDATLGGLGIA